MKHKAIIPSHPSPGAGHVVEVELTLPPNQAGEGSREGNRKSPEPVTLRVKVIDTVEQASPQNKNEDACRASPRDVHRRGGLGDLFRLVVEFFYQYVRRVLGGDNS